MKKSNIQYKQFWFDRFYSSFHPFVKAFPNITHKLQCNNLFCNTFTFNEKITFLQKCKAIISSIHDEYNWRLVVELIISSKLYFRCKFELKYNKIHCRFLYKINYFVFIAFILQNNYLLSNEDIININNRFSVCFSIF